MDWLVVVYEVKKQCNNVILGVIEELEQWFPLQEIMNVMCIIYPPILVSIKSWTHFLHIT